MKKELVKKFCQTCQKEIIPKYYHTPSNWGKVKFCCSKCYRPNPEALRKLLEGGCKSRFKKGSSPWHKGKIGVYSKETLNKMSLKKIGRLPSNTKKDDDIHYTTLHKWVTRHLGHPTICEHCGRERRWMHWASKSHKYKRDVNDWIRLCVPCHSKYDKNRGDTKIIYGKDYYKKS